MSRGAAAPALVAILVFLASASAVAPARAAVVRMSPPVLALNGNGAIRDGRLPVIVRWQQPVAAGGIARYQLQRSTNSGPWAAVDLPTSLAVEAKLDLKPRAGYRFRVREIYVDGTRGGWATAGSVWLAAAQEVSDSVELSSGWSVATHRSAYHGARALTELAGASGRFAFVGRAIAWVAETRPGGGRADVYVDGRLADSVDLRSPTTRWRRLVFSMSWPADGRHVIEIRATGTGRVSLDALLTMRTALTESLVGAGDISSCSNDGDTRTAAVVAGIAGTVFTAGDNAYSSGTAAEFAGCYDPTWGAFRDRTRPVPGNHEYGTPGASGYFGYFGARAGDPGKGWYAYDVGTWRVYALNSECRHIGGCHAGSVQYEWLARQLAAEPHRCTAAVWHRPLFSSGPHGSSTAMTDIYALLDGAGAELVLTGHDHSYERFAPAHADGSADSGAIRQFVVGTGGAALYQFETIHPLSEARNSSTHGVLRLDLAPGGYSWQFLAVAGGTFTDQGEKTCH